MLKAFCPVITMLLLFATRLERATPRLVASVAVISAGVAIASYGEMHLSLVRRRRDGGGGGRCDACDAPVRRRRKDSLLFLCPSFLLRPSLLPPPYPAHASFPAHCLQVGVATMLTSVVAESSRLVMTQHLLVGRRGGEKCRPEGSSWS